MSTFRSRLASWIRTGIFSLEILHLRRGSRVRFLDMPPPRQQEPCACSWRSQRRCSMKSSQTSLVVLSVGSWPLPFSTAQLVSPLFVLDAENLVETRSKPRRKQAAYYTGQDSHYPTGSEQMRGFQIAGDFNFCFSPSGLLRNPSSIHQN
jgi:hypothetical protein